VREHDLVHESTPGGGVLDPLWAPADVRTIGSCTFPSDSDSKRILAYSISVRLVRRGFIPRNESEVDT
jgi:hypothetical protein